MSNKFTILVGNGLGMALDHEYFTLEAGMKAAWGQMKEEAGIFKKAIRVFLYRAIPKNEDDLRKFHDAFITLLKMESLAREIPKEIMTIVHPEAQNYKTSYREYMLRIAAHFFNFDIKNHNVSFEKFIEKLTDFIRKNFESGGVVHVATLNYDGLLYRELIKSEVIHGKHGNLFDGISTTKGFERGVLDWSGKGRYLHLHGSPRFYTDGDNTIKKDSEEDGRNAFNPFEVDDKFRPHIVLCHPTQKESYINRSELLRTYFEYFEKSLEESDCLIIIGYSGKDSHINEAIKERQRKSHKPFTVRVVEYKDSKYGEGERQCFWRNELGTDVDYQDFSSILEYDFPLT